jgi:PAS domain S-box-containing protein
MEQTSELKKAKQMAELNLMQQRINELENICISPDTDQTNIRQQNEVSLRILNSIPFQVYLIDASDLTIKLTNLEGFNYVSSTQDSHCYSYIHGLNEPCGNTGYPCVLEKVKEAKKFVIVENTILDEDGKLRYIEIQGYPIFDMNGNVVYMVEAIIDISLRKIAEKGLLESEHKYRKLFEEANDAIFLSDVHTGYIVDANKQAELLLGRSVKEIIGMHHSRLYDTKKSRNSGKIRLNENLHDFDTTVSRKSGEIVPVHISSSELTLSGKQLVQEIFRDITNLKQAENQLMDYQKELRSLASQLSLAEERERRRLATYVHDHIGQNIAVCSMKLSALLEELPSTRTKKVIDEVDTLLKHMITETRALTFELSSPLLYELGLEAAIEQLTEQLQEQHGIQFSFKNDRHHKPLDDDIRILVFQAVRELLINAVKHSQASLIKVSLKRVNNRLCTYVEDNGTGFDTSQFSNNRKRFKGFGLFSIRERLNLVGGNIEIKPMTETGTQIILTVPLKL